VIVAAALSDKAWAAILAAAKPHSPDAEARAALSKALFEDYPGFTYDRERWAKTAERAERMLKHLDAFTVDYCAEFAPTDDAVRTNDVKIRIKPDLWCLEGLRSRPAAALHVARKLQDANSRRQNEQRAMLYHWLCGVWLYHFGGRLTYDRSSGGEPGGPLVEFILAAMRQVMPEDALPSREAVRDNIDRERVAREHAARVALQIQNRGMVD
jgi:hypothetical protein